MNHPLLIAVLILAPLIGFLINGLRYQKNSANLSGILATSAAVLSFFVSVILVSEIFSLPQESRKIVVQFFEWIHVDSFRVNFGFLLDPLNSIMILIITGVGSLIHLFSIGYMSHDHGAAKYFAYLNLFLFNMLILVLADNLLVMFVGWEGVGLCSYLLIGFWFKDSQKAAAGMKAFVTNRVGDAAFLLGIFILFLTFGTVQFSDLVAMAPSVAEVSWWGPITLGTLFLFVGATGKSAQIPLYVWLPDAMAGPTPVSALIHAATMVTAGVYMIIRLNPLFLAAPNTMAVIAVIGVLTAVVAACIGLLQNDIKKILAYSTVSQLGYMFLACGVGAFGAALFHLMTHAFFKALMFLGSGSVIHAMHEEQDVRKMGGLKKYLPITHATFFIGWLAIIGMPPFAGFFSKDEILGMSFQSPYGNAAFWALGVFGAILTAFYMTRLMALTFWGKARFSDKLHPHESPWTMTLPLCVLAFLSAVGGWIGIPHVIGELLPGHPENFLEKFLEHSILPILDLPKAMPTMEYLLMGTSVLLAALSAYFAYTMYLLKPEWPKKLADKFRPLHELVSNKFYVDEIYESSLIQPLIQLSKNIWLYVDVNLIDKTTYVVSDLTKGCGGFVRILQNGNAQTYATYISIGIVLILSILLMR